MSHPGGAHFEGLMRPWRAALCDKSRISEEVTCEGAASAASENSGSKRSWGKGKAWHRVSGSESLREPRKCYW